MANGFQRYIISTLILKFHQKLKAKKVRKIFYKLFAQVVDYHTVILALKIIFTNRETLFSAKHVRILVIIGTFYSITLAIDEANIQLTAKCSRFES